MARGKECRNCFFDTDFRNFPKIKKGTLLRSLKLNISHSRRMEKKLLQELKRERNEYESIRSDADQMIRKGGDEPEGTGMMAKFSADMMTAGQMMMDDSRSKIAEMMIQGTTMGIVKTIRHLKDYEGQDEKARQLGERLLNIQEENVEKMKAYL